jgi:hypothetical protein
MKARNRIWPVLITLTAVSGLGMAGCKESEKLSLAPGADPNSITNDPVIPPTPGGGVDAAGLYTGPAELAKYVQKFIDDGKAQGVDVLSGLSAPKLQIQISSLDSWGSSVIGLCETGTGLRRVTFDPDFWNSVSETQRELLAHHELGHCVLYRPHRTSTLSSGAYASVMYPIIMSSSTYTNNYNYYLNELFTFNAAQGPSTPGEPETPTVHVCDENELKSFTLSE